MSIELEARIKAAVTLADVLAYADSLLSPVPHGPFAIESALPATDIAVAPFAVPEHGHRRYKDVFTLWEHGYLRISVGPIARVSLAVGYCAFPQEIEPGPGQSEAPVGGNDGGDDEGLGYQAIVDAGGLRTRASFCLAALLVSAIASRNRSRIVDDSKLLSHGPLVDPASIEALFARRRGADSFEELADEFCDEINFQRSWPRAADELAKR